MYGGPKWTRTIDLTLIRLGLYQNELLPVYGAPERSRTPNLLIRSQTLYPIELRALIYNAEGRT